MDLKLIAGDFLHDDSIPKPDRWLLLYFKTEQQRRFLAYHLQFSDLHEQDAGHFYRTFTDHTGIYCSKRVLQKWIKKLYDLRAIVESANERFDLETLEKVKTGKYRFSHEKKTSGDSGDGRLSVG